MNKAEFDSYKKTLKEIIEEQRSKRDLSCTDAINVLIGCITVGEEKKLTTNQLKEIFEIPEEVFKK